MEESEVVIEFIRRYLNWKRFYLCNIKQLNSKLPHLDTCDFESIVVDANAKPMYHRLYNAFMLLISSKIIDGKLFDQVNFCWITCKQVVKWNQLVLLTFYYFKHFFPAALFWYKSTIYDDFAKAARQLVLEKYFSFTTVDIDMTEQYDLSNGWQLKVRYLGNETSENSLYTFNILNNPLLVNSTTCERKLNSKVIVVNYEDIEHLATTIYMNYSSLVQNRQFIVCKEKTAFSKFSSILKLKFVAPIDAKPFLARTKIEKCTPMYFLFSKETDLVTLVRVHNAYVQHGNDQSYHVISIPNMIKNKLKVPVQSIESFVSLLSNIERVSLSASCNCETRIHKEMLKACLEQSGFISIYDLKNYDTLAYVKNRVIHLTAMFKKTMYRKPFFEKKRKTTRKS